MTVVCNGFPKTGTHALQRAVRLLGCKDTRQGHFPFHVVHVAQGQHIHICRDPRNALVSWVRWTNPPRDVMRPDVMEGLLIGAIQGFRAGRSFHLIGSRYCTGTQGHLASSCAHACRCP